MPKELKESILKTIGSRFYIWFLTLAVVVVTVVWLTQMEASSILWVRATGGVAVLPLVGILRVVVRTKKDKTDDEAKLKLVQEKHAYKLEKLRIKHNIKEQ